ncbi:hypothetical protein FHS24_000298 [Psychrobacter luti]|uniref:Uncharacterized protein n=1 Tax=Psychrobacter luti TaxID=198481 RepID=A0A839T8M5_9GAMM|nr:hypothetical protein [Psychrobacter luti]
MRAKKLKKVNRPGIIGDLTLLKNTTMKARNYKLEIKERAIHMLIEAANNYLLHGQPSKSSVAKGFLLSVYRDTN